MRKYIIVVTVDPTQVAHRILSAKLRTVELPAFFRQFEQVPCDNNLLKANNFGRIFFHRSSVVVFTGKICFWKYTISILALHIHLCSVIPAIA